MTDSTLPRWKTEDRPPRILIVDDDREISDSLVYAFEDKGYQVQVAGDGNEGVAMAEASDFDLLVLDMMMPKRSGFLVLEHLRKNKSEQFRVIMVTGNDGQRHQAYAEMLGVEDYIHKPFVMDRLLDSVATLLEKPFPHESAS